MGTASYAALAETPSGQSMTFTGQVQGVDVGQGVVVVRGPKQGDKSSGIQSGQTTVIIVLTKIFRIDKTTKISVGGQSKTNLADVKNGDPISVEFIQSNSGQFLAKSVTDTVRPPPKPPQSSY
jgi:hypothetical protein